MPGSLTISALPSAYNYPMKPHSTIHAEPRWRPGNMIRRQLPDALHDWLLAESSLTRRLQMVCRGQFRVELISLGWERPLPDEAQALGVAPRQGALIRQVRLWCDNQPWVFARTVIPFSSLRGAQRRLAYLGSRPLGAFLFADPALQRSPLQVARVAPNSRVLSACTLANATLWGRRSIFRLRGHPLLVSEFFLPDIPPFHSRNSHE